MKTIRSTVIAARTSTRLGTLAALGVACSLATATSTLSAAATPVPATPLRQGAPAPHIQLDRSGQPRVGKASFYAARYSGKTMADGTPMHLYSNNAASLTLPLGSTAKVTNLETGRSAIVTIRDRGPYVGGRIVDLSPGTARQIGMDPRKGLARVEVRPLSVPRVDGTVWTAPATPT